MLTFKLPVIFISHTHTHEEIFMELIYTYIYIHKYVISFNTVYYALFRITRCFDLNHRLAPSVLRDRLVEGLHMPSIGIVLINFTARNL